MNFENKVVLITGASSGIGKAIALQLSKEKCKLILLARRIELLEELKNQSSFTNNQTVIIKCDVGKKDEVVSAYKMIKENLGIDHTLFKILLRQALSCSIFYKQDTAKTLRPIAALNIYPNNSNRANHHLFPVQADTRQHSRAAERFVQLNFPR